MKEWFIEHYAEIKYWEAIGALILTFPLFIYWVILVIEHNKRNKKGKGK